MFIVAFRKGKICLRRAMAWQMCEVAGDFVTWLELFKQNSKENQKKWRDINHKIARNWMFNEKKD